MPNKIKGWKVAAWGAVLGVLVFTLAMLWTAPNDRHPCLDQVQSGVPTCP